MRACCVVGCAGPNTPNPVFFEFPSSRLLRKRWLDAINSPSAGEQASVCIRHFTRADYTLVRGEARLRGRSVPSRRIRESDDDSSETDSDSTELNSDGKEEKTKKTSKNANDNGTTNNDNEINTEICKDNITYNMTVTEDNEEADHNRNIDNKKENNEKEIDEINGDNSKCETQIENDPANANNSCTENVNTENCDNRLNNEVSEKTYNDNGVVNNDNEKVNNDNEKLNNDNESVNNDNEKINNDITNTKKVQGKKTRCKITALRAINGRRKFSFSSDSTNSDSVSSSPRGAEVEGSKEDIEEALQHYYIENKKTERQLAAMADVIHEEQEKMAEENRKEESGVFEQSAPVFIELSVGHGSTAGQDSNEADCLMVLENVECDVDPALLLAAREEEEENMEHVDLADDDDDDEPQPVENKNQDPISLLTSSDEDDVILQEPKYDLVEVSSADTSEDDMPLVKLVKPTKPNSNKAPYSAKYTKNLINKLIWGRNDFYCVQCGFTTTNAGEYNRHVATHNTVSPGQKIIQYCQDCGFTTSSKHQMQKHKQKHKNEKRFKCQKCNYSAKHSMSLVYHMKTHKNSGLNEVELAICGTYDPAHAPNRSKRSRKSDRKVSDEDKKYKCATCGYKTNRRSDLKRHRRRIHDGDDDDDDDVEYQP